MIEYLENCNCNLCGSDDKSLVGRAKDYYNNFDGEYSYYKCNQCGFVYTNPRPKAEFIDKFYPDDAGYLTPKKVIPYTVKERKVLNIYFNYQKSYLLNKLLFWPFYAVTIRKLKIRSVPTWVNKGEILDIGASYGDYMFKVKQIGWKAKGIELNSKSVRHATEQLKLDVENILIEDFSSETKFDVVNMGMVMEHILEPNIVVKKVESLLKPNGTFIFSIPNYGGIESKIFGKYWYSLHLPMHINHFTPRTVKYLLKKNGFSKVKIYHQNDYNDFIRSLSNMLQDKPYLKVIHSFINSKFVRKLFVAPIVFILSLFNLTSRMTVYCQK